jgi:polyisoprenoid-binding protein YceI
VAHYRVDPAQSWVEIHARSSLHPIDIRTAGLEGDLQLEVSDGGHVSAQSDTGGRISMAVDRLKSGNPLQDRELRRRIDARRNPEIVGELTGLRETETSGRYSVRGDITFRGVTRPYEDEMIVTIHERAIEMEGEATFDIRDFGMDPPRILMLRVEPEVRVRAHIVAERAV